jgi:hypothetical protein
MRTGISQSAIKSKMASHVATMRAQLCSKLSLIKASKTGVLESLVRPNYVREGTKFKESALGEKTTILVVNDDLSHIIWTDPDASLRTAGECLEPFPKQNVFPNERILNKAKHWYQHLFVKMY